jgi:hypothetical protein
VLARSGHAVGWIENSTGRTFRISMDVFATINLRAPGKYHMKNIMLAFVAVLAGCASEKISQTQTSNPISEKIYHTQTSNPTGIAVLVGRSARIVGRELVWSCVYQTEGAQVVVEQHEECGRAQ